METSKMIARLIRFIFVDYPRNMKNRLKDKASPVDYARSIGVRIGKGSRIYGSALGMFGSEPWLITLGENVHVVGDCKFITHDGGTLILRKEIPDLEITKPIVVGNDVYFGSRVIVLPGVTIGNRCVIGAGSVVTRDIPDNSLAVGVPAKPIKSTDEYRDKLAAESLHLGHLSAADKERELKKLFNITHI